MHDQETGSNPEVESPLEARRNTVRVSWMLFLVAVPLGLPGGPLGILSLIIVIIGLVLYIKGLVGVIRHGVKGMRFDFIFASILYALILLGMVIGIVKSS
jgi:hypothetical protein